MPEIYDRLYRFGGNGGHYDGGRRSLDGWQIFCAGGSRAFRQRGGTLPFRSGGRADDAGIFEKHMPEQGVLGFDGRVVDTAEGERIAKALSGKKVRISEGEDLVGSIWDDRPALPMNPVWILEEKYAGNRRRRRLQICAGR